MEGGESKDEWWDSGWGGGIINKGGKGRVLGVREGLGIRNK